MPQRATVRREAPWHATGCCGTTPRQVRLSVLAERNVRDLAALLHTEARGQGRAGMTAVGSTVLNRMRRNGDAAVRDVWGQYSHGLAPGAEALAVARDLLDGRLPDPTNGATHYYSPNAMVKENQLTNGGRGYVLESVPGVVDPATGRPVRNRVPAYALAFDPRQVPGIPDSAFKFFKQPEDGRRVR